MKQNITLSVDKEILRKSKIIAAKKDMSVSKMLGDILKELADREDKYLAAQKKAIKNLESGFNLGGKKTWSREELYER
ncbi:MAG: hypothetical protein GX654_09965 [Desulfatiglans sp.]|jgi:predicted transcriptional regulator|nr:hypothetical protein [Desulfatiglans sp.]